MNGSNRWARALNLLLGIWLFISAFAWDHTPAERANTWILGVLCVVFAVMAMTAAPAAHWLNSALAVWLFVSVWALPHASRATEWNNALVAVAVLFLSLVPGRAEPPMTPQGAGT